jgi:hypothetical protein
MFYERMWKNVVQQRRPQTTVRHMSFACRITKATGMYAKYLILISLPQFYESASMLRYTYIACLVCLKQILY